MRGSGGALAAAAGAEEAVCGGSDRRRQERRRSPRCRRCGGPGSQPARGAVEAVRASGPCKERASAYPCPVFKSCPSTRAQAHARTRAPTHDKQHPRPPARTPLLPPIRWRPPRTRRSLWRTCQRTSRRAGRGGGEGGALPSQQPLGAAGPRASRGFPGLRRRRSGSPYARTCERTPPNGRPSPVHPFSTTRHPPSHAPTHPPTTQPRIPNPPRHPPPTHPPTPS
jgi:hypothetical protein